MEEKKFFIAAINGEFNLEQTSRQAVRNAGVKISIACHRKEVISETTGRVGGGEEGDRHENLYTDPYFAGKAGRIVGSLRKRALLYHREWQLPEINERQATLLSICRMMNSFIRYQCRNIK